MSMNDSPQAVPVDLVRVREAAQAVGFSAHTVRSWIKSGKLTVQPGPGVRRVSLAAVQVLAAPPDPHAPADAVGIYDALRLTDVTRRNIEAWLTEGRLPSWHGRLGRLVRVADVQALTQQRAIAAVAAGDGTPRPHDALLIGDAARQVGVSRGRLYNWIRRGPGAGNVSAWPMFWP